ncbi:MAG: threonine/serine dehydratase [Thermoplasmata archaeon]
MQPPTLEDVYRAKEIIRRHLNPTPLLSSPQLSSMLGFKTLIKVESFLPTGSFKVRGGLNLISQLGPEERKAGIIAASTGNHGQSLAYASNLLGVDAIIAAPKGANPLKVMSMEALGAEVVLRGKDYDEAREWAEREAAEKGYRYVHSANEPLLIAGVATAALEVLEDEPEVEAILVPVGGGSGASAYCTVIKALSPSVEVIGVQSELAPAFYRSWKERRMLEMPSSDTFAEGLQTRVPFQLTMEILWDRLDDFLLVSDEELKSGIVAYMSEAHLVAEGAAAAPLAAAFRYRNRWKGKRVVLVLTGHNITLENLRTVLRDYETLGD